MGSRVRLWRPAGPEYLAVAVLSVPVVAGTVFPYRSVVGLVWAVVLLVPFLWWRRCPDAVMVTLVVVGAAQLAVTDEPSVANVTMVAGLCAVARRGPRSRSLGWVTVVAVGAGTAAFDWTRDEVGHVPGTVLWWDLAVLTAAQAVLALLAWLAGDLIRVTTTLRNERRAGAAAARVYDIRMAIVAERAQIGREVHDIVGHALALIAVQADAGLYLATAPVSEIDLTPDVRLQQAGAALEAIKAQASGALDETRGLVRRIGDDDPTDRAPVLRLDDVANLIGELQRTSIAATLSLTGDPATVDLPIQASLYRIIQEALTNAVKHSDRGQVTVEVDITSQGAAAIITNTRLSPSTGRLGRGLAGMNERAHAHGGWINAGRVGTDIYRVEAVLPTHATELP